MCGRPDSAELHGKLYGEHKAPPAENGFERQPHELRASMQRGDQLIQQQGKQPVIAERQVLRLAQQDL